MKQILSWKKIPLLLLACGVVLTVAFSQSNSGNQKYTSTDTLPDKVKKVRDLDEALAEIERGEIEMQKAFKEIDSDKIETEIRQAMKSMEIDMAKMKEDLAKAMKEIDMEKINLEVQQAMKQISDEKIKVEIETSLAKVDMEKVKAEMEKVKEIDFKKIKEDVQAIQPQIEKAMKEARVGLEKAKKEISSYKGLVDALEKDGHLKKGEDYTIEYKSKELTVNGKELSAEETQKYSTYLSDKDHFTLKKNTDGLNIEN